MKRHLGINLASRPLRNQLVPGLALGLLGLATVLATFLNVYLYATRAREARVVSERLEATKVEVEDLRQREREMWRRMEGIDVAALNRQAEAANELLRRRGFSWTRLFNELEKVQPYPVQLTSIQPGSVRGAIEINIQGEAKTHDDFVAYEDRLEESPRFSKVYPGGESVTNQGAIRFSLRMTYHPPVDEDPADTLTADAETPERPSTDQGAGS